MDERRAARVSEAVREELSEILNFEMADPRLKGLDVTDVHLTPDGKQARVKVALFGTDAEQENATAALEHARNYLRHELARRLTLRRVPELVFTTDQFQGVAERVDLLLKRAKKKRGMS